MLRDWLRQPAARPILLLFGGLAVALTLAFLAKQPCLDHAWDGFQYRAFCYNDLVPQYAGRNFDQPGLPYWDFEPPERHAVEYPVVVGMTEWLAARNVDSAAGFFVKNALLLSIVAGCTLALLLGMHRPPRQILRFAAAPSLVWGAFHNWDLYPVLFTVLAFWCFERNRPAGVGAALALGASAKFYPAFFAPVFLLHYATRAPKRTTARFLAGFAGIGLLVNGPFMLANWAGWWWTFAFHLKRGVTFESVWWTGEHYLKAWGLIANPDLDLTRTFGLVTALLFLLLYAIPLWRTWRGRTTPLEASWEVLLLFLLTSKVFSVQYEIWILAFFALLRLPWSQYVASEVASTLVYLAVFLFFLDPGRWTPFLALASVLRHGALLWMLASSLRRAYPEEPGRPWRKRSETGARMRATVPVSD